ncbi:MAG: DUF3574 domain-containing protein [Phenylobacterium sp.]|uniref:DUF3574 domain-containing protein n=1 Tax=Phenylobacterium sp. TaxID=1871053 RepID=UPI002735DD15|nr:DUF3574 domain-containing protein [Phenylobacterium sp.]MDP3174787.1 DUF3574 domain-containing protein [Phenylobacterium sp.]
MRRIWGAMAAASALLGGCASVDMPEQPACPVGQEPMRMAQMFFGRNIGDQPGVTDEAFAKFVDEELTPRFPDGLTILEGGGQWRGSENKLIREAAKIVLIVLPSRGDVSAKVEAARSAYKTKFKQDSVLLLTQETCVSF